jgi:glycosyltransferase involved in cell wall biosynthesis
MTNELDVRGGEYRVIPKAPPRRLWPLPFLRAVREYRRVIDAERVRLVHVNDVGGYLWVGRACRSNPLPVVCHVRFPYTEAGLSYVAMHTRRPDILLYNSEFMARDLGFLAERHMPGAKRVVLHNAVDTAVFAPAASQRVDRAAGRQVVAIIANFTPMKDHETFLRMAAEVHRKVPHALFWLAGMDVLSGGRREVELKALAAELGIERVAHFLGFVADVPRLLASCDLVVCTSRIEPFGRCVLEAMACGKAVVASRVGGIPEVLGNDGAGVLLDPGDVEGFADAVRDLLDNPERRTEMGAAARRRAVDNFGVEAHMNKLENIYERLLAN